MKTADKEAHRGVGLGSEVSQIIALDYASPIDHYVKDVRGIHGYGRYMDDGYVISNSLEELEDIKRNLYRLAEALGIAMSDKKNIITPFRHHSFTFLKMRVTLTETGKVVMKLSRKSIRAMRRKMDIFRRWMDRGPNGTGGRVPVLSIVESAREAVQQLRHAARHGRALHADVR